MRAYEIGIETDEDGFYLVLRTDAGHLRVNVQDCATQLLREAQNVIGPWAEEAASVRRIFERGAEEVERLEYLRGELRAERISYGELAELQGLAEHIEPGDVELLEAAGVPESEAYERSDPKHPRHHSTHVDLWDVYREGK